MVIDFFRKIKRAIFNAPPKKRVVKDYFSTNYNQKALLSYITLPFIKELQYKHTNHMESFIIAQILNELCFQVDVIDYDNKQSNIDFRQYDLVIGFGFPLEQSFYTIDIKKTKTIFYGTGNHYTFINKETLKRVYDVYIKTDKLMLNSIRFAEYMWSLQTSLSTGLILLGNDYTKNTFEKYYLGKHIYTIPALFHKTMSLDITKKDFGKSKNNFLWFGSNGLLHKGLDLLLEIFANREDITLHICGANKWEKAFFDYYQPLLFGRKNIINHDFVDIYSEQFKNLLEVCAFVIFPSASEGGCASVVTVMGNGGLIPIVSKASCLDVELEGFVFDELSKEDILREIEVAINLPHIELLKRSISIYNQINKEHSIENYSLIMRGFIENILNSN